MLWSRGVLPIVALGFAAVRPPCPQRVGPSASMCLSPDSMTYRELQQACKSRGLGARGKTEDLRDRLRAALSTDDREQASAAGVGLSASGAVASPPDQLDPPISERGGDNDELGLMAELGLDVDEGDATTPLPQGGFDSLDDDDLLAELLRDLDDDSEALPPGAAPNSVNPHQRTTTFSDDPDDLLGDASLANALEALDRLDAAPGDELLQRPDSAADAGADEADLDKFDETWLDDLFGPLSSEVPPPAEKRPRDTTGAGDAGAWRPRAGARETRRPAPPTAPRSSDSFRWPEQVDEHSALRRSIRSASMQGSHQRVLQSFDTWRQRQAPVEEAVHRAALLACEFEGNWQLAAELINELEAHGVPLETAHFDMALRACDRASRWQEALALFERLRNSGLRPSARSFEIVLRTCAKGNQSGIVLKLWDMLREEQQRQPPLSVTPFTYNVLMRALAEDGNRGADAPRREASSRRVVEAFNEVPSPDLARPAPLLVPASRAKRALPIHPADGFAAPAPGCSTSLVSLPARARG